MMGKTTDLVKEASNRGLDAQRFYQIAKGLHAQTTFEQIDTVHKFDREGGLLHRIDERHIAVNGTNKSLDILASLDLSLIVNLDTEGQMPFCIARNGNILYAGCNQGYLFGWNMNHGFQ